MGHHILGEIVGVLADEDVLDEAGNADAKKLNALVYDQMQGSADSASSAFQTGHCAPASSKKRLRSRFKALISTTAFIAWSEAQILPSEVAHMSLKKCRQVLR